jgi:hypothetical protein
VRPPRRARLQRTWAPHAPPPAALRVKCLGGGGISAAAGGAPGGVRRPGRRRCAPTRVAQTRGRRSRCMSRSTWPANGPGLSHRGCFACTQVARLVRVAGARPGPRPDPASAGPRVCTDSPSFASARSVCKPAETERRSTRRGRTRAARSASWPENEPAGRRRRSPLVSHGPPTERRAARPALKFTSGTWGTETLRWESLPLVNLPHPRWEMWRRRNVGARGGDKVGMQQRADLPFIGASWLLTRLDAQFASSAGTAPLGGPFARSRATDWPGNATSEPAARGLGGACPPSVRTSAGMDCDPVAAPRTARLARADQTAE